MIENIAEIKENINIIDIVNDYIPLKKSGANYSSCCPFHNEKSPSFVVNMQKNIFHCFGCGEGGNGIDFIMKYERMEFIEALKKAAQICNIEVKESNNVATRDRFEKISKMQENLERLNVYMRNNLLKHEKLLAYLLKRGFTYEVIEKYGLGLALEKQQMQDIVGLDYAKELGLITEKGFNFFQNRLMLCIRDANNHIVGFSGRIHDYCNFSNTPKYINSKESIIYKKSNILYNLNFAREIMKNSRPDSIGMRAKKVLFIVEGYFDALTCNLLQIPSVALCGTALNANHLKNITKYFSDDTQIYIALDSDEAGRNASIRAYKVFLEYGFVDVNIARLRKEFKDINEYFMQREGQQGQIFRFYKGLDYALRVELGQGSIKEKQEKLKYYESIYHKMRDYFIIEYMKPYMQKYLVKRNIEFKENIDDTESILIQLANDRDKRFLANDILSSDDFLNKKEAFLDIMGNKQTAICREYALKECPTIDNDNFYKIILRYKIINLEMKLKKALNIKPFDREYIISLNKKIQEFKENLAIPF